MKAFVSGQLGDKLEVRRMQDRLRDIGFDISHDWTRTDDLSDKLRNRGECGERARRDIDGVAQCDVYVLLSDNSACGKGMYAELGAALALHQLTGRPEVYVVGAMRHLSVFYLHPAVHAVPNADLLISMLSESVPNLDVSLSA